MRPAGVARALARQAINELRVAARRAIAVRPRRTSAATQSLVDRLRRDGYAVVPTFLTAARCAELRDRVDGALEEHAQFVQQDPMGADRRLFGLDAYDPEIRAIAFDPFLIDVLKTYERASSHEGFALCAHLRTRPHNLGSGQGWHRDSAAYTQTKYMVYLSDVGSDNGPFQYVRGSHRSEQILRAIFAYGYAANQFRFTDEEISRLTTAELGRLQTFTAPAGTAIVFDSRGLHRGMPIASGDRYAITTYLWFDRPPVGHVRALTIAEQRRRSDGGLG